jgi:S1-C subfamily serine protease
VLGDVYPGTDAQRQGLRAGDALRSIDGVAIAPIADKAVVTGLLRAHNVGALVTLDIDRPAGLATVEVVVEDLLPAFPGAEGQ